MNEETMKQATDTTRQKYLDQLGKLIDIPPSHINDHQMIIKLLKAKDDEMRREGERGAWAYDPRKHQRLVTALDGERLIQRGKELLARAKEEEAKANN